MKGTSGRCVQFRTFVLAPVRAPLLGQGCGAVDGFQVGSATLKSLDETTEDLEAGEKEKLYLLTSVFQGNMEIWWGEGGGDWDRQYQ